VQDLSIEDESSADIFAGSYFGSRNTIQKQTQIVVNQNYPIETIKV
jgi:hypothetical protein